MNIEIKDVSVTRKTLVVTLDPSEVDAEHRAVVAEFAQQVRLPGFRPGKAPAAIVQKQFAKDIQGEFTQKVVGKAYREGIEQSKLAVYAIVDVQEGLVQPGLSAAVTLTLDLQANFELPEYKGLATEVLPVEPTDAEVEAAIQAMRSERADFKVVTRAAQKGDYVKLSYEGKIAGQPITEILPDKAVFAKVPQTWEEVEGTEGLIPGLGTSLGGLEVGGKKDVTVKFPEPFQEPALAGKEAVYAVEVLEIRERVLPELNEEFFKAHQVENAEGLKARVLEDLKYRKEMENRSAQRRQVTDVLAGKVEFAVPESLIETETQTLLRRFMEENMKRGVPQEAFEANKAKLFEDARVAASRSAKVQLILGRIAEQEKLEVKDQDVDRYLRMEAMRAGQKPEKFAKELGKDRGRIQAMQRSILLDKALDFVVSQATVATVPAKA